MGCLEKPIGRCRNGAWRAALAMLAFLCFGVNSGIWRPAMFPLNMTACCQANLDVWSLFHQFQSIDVAALQEPWCLVPCLVSGPTLGIWWKDMCPSTLWVKEQRPRGQLNRKSTFLFSLERGPRFFGSDQHRTL